MSVDVLNYVGNASSADCNKKDLNTRGDEREEGEIVDDYEYIISSDEELAVRQRIIDLEQKNNELEEIARISGTTTNPYMYARQDASLSRYGLLLHTEVSPLPPVDFLRSNKRKYPKVYNKDNDYHVRPKRKCYRYKRKKEKRKTCGWSKHSIHYQDGNVTSSGSVDDEKDPIIIDSSAEEDNYSNYNGYINRERLRFAVARTANAERKANSLKERLQKENDPKSNKELTNFIQMPSLESQSKANECQECDSDSSISLEEQELRLIALKSAVMKKHIARKKRFAESAYSPTDFDEILACDEDNNDNIDLVNVELENSQIGMEISPESSPKISLDHEDSSSMSISTELNKFSADVKPIDMDIADTESEHDNPIFIRATSMLPAIEEIPLPLPLNPGFGEQSESFGSISNEVQHKDEWMNQYNLKIQTHHIEGCDFNYETDSNSRTQNIPENYALQLHSPIDADKIDESSNEEEEALRALLLSKFQVQKNLKATTKKKATIVPFIEEQSTIMQSVNFANITEAHNQIIKNKPTESILKDAVRRLKLQTDCKDALRAKIKNVPAKYVSNQSRSPHLLQNSMADSIMLEKTNIASKEFELEQVEQCEENRMMVINHHGRSNDSTLEFCQQERAEFQFEKTLRSLVHAKFIDAATLDCYGDKQYVESSEHIQGDKKVDNATEFVEDTSFEQKIFKDIVHLKPTDRQLQKQSVAAKADTVIVVSNVNQSKSEMDVIVKNKITSEPKALNNLQATPITHSTSVLKTNAVHKINNNATRRFNLVTVTSNLVPPKSKVKKFIKKNKVINTRTEFQSIDNLTKVNSNANAKESKKPDMLNSSTRFITSADLVKVPKSKVIITLRASDTETSDDELVLKTPLSPPSAHPFGTPTNQQQHVDDDADVLEHLLENNNQVEQVSNLVNATTSPTLGAVVVPEKQSQNLTQRNGAFEKRLDNFLKDVRARAEDQIYVPRKTNTEKVATVMTPLAVRHLPEASQREYRRLIHRMKMLEKQKLSAKKNPIDVELEVRSQNTTLHDTELNETHKVIPDKSSPVHEPLERRNENIQQESDLLHVYEKEFQKVGCALISNLDKSLQLVEEAKNVKISRLFCEHRLEQLSLEMEKVKHKFNEEQKNLALITPEIYKSNEQITAMSRNRVKLLSAAVTLGKNAKGDDYRLNNSLKEEISKKKKKLAKEIQFINNLKSTDFEEKKLIKHRLNYMKVKLTGSGSAENNELISKEFNRDVEGSDESSSHNIAETGSSLVNLSVPRQSSTCVSHEPELLAEQAVEGNEETMDCDTAIVSDPQSNEGTMDAICNENCYETKHCSATDMSTKGEREISFTYVSPLGHMQSKQSLSRLDPHGIVCPYELKGQCKDSDCNYLHLFE